MIESIFIYERLNYLISIRKTGTRKDLAKKFNVSERTVSRWIDFMKSHGAEISFCRIRKSFYYNTPGNFIIKLEFVNAPGVEQSKYVSS